MTVAAFVLGIVSLVLSLLGGWCSIIAFPMAIVGLILSIIAKKKQPSGLATAALVIGIVAVVLTAIFFFTCGICVLCVTKVIEDSLENVNTDELVSSLESLFN